jgi:hypothetical protein
LLSFLGGDKMAERLHLCRRTLKAASDGRGVQAFSMHGAEMAQERLIEIGLALRRTGF